MHRFRCSTLLMAVISMIPQFPASTEAAVPQGFVDEVVVSGLNLPIGFAHLPDGRILIAQKSGIVRLVKNGVLQTTPFIDLRTRVNDYWDRGMVGLAVDPSFASNGYVYLYYVYEHNAADYSGPKTARLTRVTAVGDTASPSSEVVLLGSLSGEGCGSFPAGSDCIPADSPSHNGGTVRFASDGSLFVGIGDGASFQIVDDLALRAQSLSSLAGKILRVTASGRGVPDNPFWNGDASSVRSKVWSYGVRNPFRGSVQPGTDLLYFGDVGWTSYEEINIARRGTNLGWPCYEGPQQQPGYASKSTCQTLYTAGANAVQTPSVSWPHNGSGAAALGGTFYTGSSFPNEYQSVYYFGDYARGNLQHLSADTNGNVIAGPAGFATGVEGPVDLQMGPDGSLYYLAINTNEFRRIRYAVTSGTQYISALEWTSAVNGWGPVERDMSNGEQAAGDGRRLTLNGVSYLRGLGTHANSDVRYALNGQCTAFNSDIGIDDEVGSGGSVVFQVWTDAVKRYESGVLTGQSATARISVDITGTRELSLRVTDAANGIASDHADWAGATVTCASGSGTPPPQISGVSARDVTSSTATIAWTTDVPADTQVEYGTTTSYGAQSPLQTTLATSHQLTLSGLTAGTVYHYRVRSRNASGVLAVSGDRTFTTTGGTPSGVQYLSDVAWTSMSNAWGPVERDRSNGETGATDGNPLTLNGKVYAKGLGVHALSEVRYAIPSGCTQFVADVGVDDEVGAGGSVVFQVWVNTNKAYESPVLRGSSATVPVSVAVAGSQLRLVVTDAGDGNGSDHADWAGARFVCGTTTPPPKISGVSATSVTSSGATITWTTDVAADTQVEYGTTTAYGAQSTLQQTLTKSHQVTLNALTAGVQYHYRVRSSDAEGRLAVSADHTFITPSGGTVGVQYLSDLAWTSMTNAWGPAERDRSNGEMGGADGNPLTLNGVVYAKGVGVHALAEVRYAIPAGCTQFAADIGVDDEVGTAGSVVFQVWVNATKVFESATLRGSSTTVAVTVPLSGSELRLVATDAGDGNGSDHADWAGARFVCSAGGNNLPVPTISSPDAALKYKVGDVIAFAGSASDAEDGSLPAAGLAWSIDIRHCPGGMCHLHPLMNAMGAGGSFTVPDHGDDSYIDVTLTATDSAGATVRTSRTVHPQTVQVVLNTTPNGLIVVYGGVSASAPLTHTSLVGSTQTISVPSPQNGLTFTGWSDGGAQAHNITVGATDATLTASFADRTAPSITSVSASTTSSSATIRWMTDEPADAQVEFGLTAAYGSTTPPVTTLSTAHSIVLTGLQAQTTYYYRVVSRDAAGNVRTSGNATFKTKR